MQDSRDEKICSSLFKALAMGVMAGAMLWPVSRLTAGFIFSSVFYYIEDSLDIAIRSLKDRCLTIVSLTQVLV